MEHDTHNRKILVTGAGGFIGGFIVEEALRRGYDTWAAVRATTSREFLTDERIHFIELDFTDDDALHDTIAAHVAEHGAWDAVIHNLGATKCTNYLDFERINFGYMRSLIEVLQDVDAMPRVFLLMSSLSVMGKGDEKGYTPFKANDVPSPDTRYGMSKLKAETYLQMHASEVPFTIFRCTGVYGPHERDYYLMLKSIKRGVDFGVGFKKQMLTFVYVKDLARAVIDAAGQEPKRRAYFISENQGYTQQEFRKIASEVLGKRHVIPITCPIWLLKVVCKVATWWGTVRMKPSTLNSDKFNILRQRNWLCDTDDAKRDLGFEAQYDLRQGLTEAVEWYREAHWL